MAIKKSDLYFSQKYVALFDQQTDVVPFPKLVDERKILSIRVDDHLKKMGAVWSI
jgi:hypothetical protein